MPALDRSSWVRGRAVEARDGRCRARVSCLVLSSIGVTRDGRCALRWRRPWRGLVTGLSCGRPARGAPGRRRPRAPAHPPRREPQRTARRARRRRVPPPPRAGALRPARDRRRFRARRVLGGAVVLARDPVKHRGQHVHRREMRVVQQQDPAPLQPRQLLRDVTVDDRFVVALPVLWIHVPPNVGQIACLQRGQQARAVRSVR